MKWRPSLSPCDGGARQAQLGVGGRACPWGTCLPGFPCRVTVQAEPVTCTGALRWVTLPSGTDTQPPAWLQAGTTGMSQSQKGRNRLSSEFFCLLDMKSRSELTSGEAFRALWILKCCKWQRKRAPGATEPAFLTCLFPGASCPEGAPPSSASHQSSHQTPAPRWCGQDRKKGLGGALQGGGKDIPGLQGLLDSHASLQR